MKATTTANRMTMPHTPPARHACRPLSVGAAGLLALAGLGTLAGCVPQEKYNAMRLRADGLEDERDRSVQNARTAQAEAASYRQQLDALASSGGNMTGLVSNLQQQNSTLQGQLDDLNRRYAETVGRIGSGPALPVALNNELTRLASENADVITFDADRGIVKFKSDVTFNSGDATVQAKANDTIARFAKILDSGPARGYELLVAGHTDSERVSNPATIRAGNKNNMYLSSHRAIGVAEALIKDGVAANRIGYVGYADTRPAASNATAAGRQQNRRVEVLILPSQAPSSGGTAGRATTASQSQSAPAPRDDNKDGPATGTPTIQFEQDPQNK